MSADQSSWTRSRRSWERRAPRHAPKTTRPVPRMTDRRFQPSALMLRPFPVTSSESSPNVTLSRSPPPSNSFCTTRGARRSRRGRQRTPPRCLPRFGYGAGRRSRLGTMPPAPERRLFSDWAAVFGACAWAGCRRAPMNASPSSALHLAKVRSTWWWPPCSHSISELRREVILPISSRSVKPPVDWRCRFFWRLFESDGPVSARACTRQVLAARPWWTSNGSRKTLPTRFAIASSRHTGVNKPAPGSDDAERQQLGLARTGGCCSCA